MLPEGKHLVAPDAVKCESGGKHVPRTVEKRGENGEIEATSLCRKCGKIA